MTTKKQIYRAYRKLWKSVTKYDGYQPWGYDEITMAIVYPGFIKARKRLRNLYKKVKS
jgi:hypothetical protein